MAGPTEIAHADGKSVAALVGEIDKGRRGGQPAAKPVGRDPHLRAGADARVAQVLAAAENAETLLPVVGRFGVRPAGLMRTRGAAHHFDGAGLLRGLGHRRLGGRRG